MKFDMSTWADEFIAADRRGMSEDEMMVMMAMTLNPDHTPEGVKEDFIYQVVEKRATYLGLNPTPDCLTFLAILVDRPGKSTMYCSVFKAKGLDMTMTNLVKLFPNGFPDDDELQRLWVAQKVEGKNGLDIWDWESNPVN